MNFHTGYRAGCLTKSDAKNTLVGGDSDGWQLPGMKRRGQSWRRKVFPQGPGGGKGAAKFLEPKSSEEGIPTGEQPVMEGEHL